MRAVLYGAGNIGRGFIGQLFSASGYSLTFIDVNEKLINEINEKKSYTVRILDKLYPEDIVVKNVSAVNGNDIEAVARAIADADIMSTSVGVNVIKFIAKPIAEGIKLRYSESNFKPLNIIICENLIDADKYIHKLISENLNYDEKEKFNKYVGLVEASVGRMVPIQTEDMKEGDELRVCVEKYGVLPVNKDAFLGDSANLVNIIPCSNFEFYVKRKLFVHNMGHAMCAYLGNISGLEYIYQAVNVPETELFAIRAMNESARSLSKEYGYDIQQLNMHIENLLYRFSNELLGDTIKRVGNDLKRKLSPNDRLIGAIKNCFEQGIEPWYLCAGVAAAMFFEDANLAGYSAEKILDEISGLEKNKWYDFIIDCYNFLNNNKDVKSFYSFVKTQVNNNIKAF